MPMTAAATMPSVSSHWKIPVPLPRMGSRQTLCEIERDYDADESAADALQEPSEEERAVAVGEGDDRDADDEGDAAEDHQGFAAHPVGEQAGEKG